jgi:hypothetical protein
MVLRVVDDIASALDVANRLMAPLSNFLPNTANVGLNCIRKRVTVHVPHAFEDGHPWNNAPFVSHEKFE